MALLFSKVNATPPTYYFEYNFQFDLILIVSYLVQYKHN